MCFLQCSSTLKFHNWHLLVQAWIHDQFLSLQRKLSNRDPNKYDNFLKSWREKLWKTMKNLKRSWKTEYFPRSQPNRRPSLACRALIVHLWDMPPGGPEIPRSPGTQMQQESAQHWQHAELNTSQWPNHDHPWDTAWATKAQFWGSGLDVFQSNKLRLFGLIFQKDRSTNEVHTSTFKVDTRTTGVSTCLKGLDSSWHPQGSRPQSLPHHATLADPASVVSQQDDTIQHMSKEKSWWAHQLALPAVHDVHVTRNDTNLHSGYFTEFKLPQAIFAIFFCTKLGQSFGKRDRKTANLASISGSLWKTQRILKSLALSS